MIDAELPAQLQVFVESPVYDTKRRIARVTYIPYTPLRKGEGIDKAMALSLVAHIQRAGVGYQLRNPKTDETLRTVTGHWTTLFNEQEKPHE